MKHKTDLGFFWKHHRDYKRELYWPSKKKKEGITYKMHQEQSEHSEAVCLLPYYHNSHKAKGGPDED